MAVVLRSRRTPTSQVEFGQRPQLNAFAGGYRRRCARENISALETSLGLRLHQDPHEKLVTSLVILGVTRNDHIYLSTDSFAPHFRQDLDSNLHFR